MKKSRQLEDKRSKMGIPLTQEDAAVMMQKVARGFLARMRLKVQAAEELEFLKMRPVATNPRRDPNTKVLQVSIPTCGPAVFAWGPGIRLVLQAGGRSEECTWDGRQGQEAMSAAPGCWGSGLLRGRRG